MTVSSKKALGVKTPNEVMSISPGPRRGPRTDAASPVGVHTRVCGWLRAWVAARAPRGWIDLQTMVDLCATELGLKIDKSVMGRAVVTEFPNAKKRNKTTKKDVGGHWVKNKTSRQYHFYETP